MKHLLPAPGHPARVRPLALLLALVGLLTLLAAPAAPAARAARAQVLRGTYAAGVSHSLSIHADGSLWATGDNTYGQLGTSTTSWVPVGTDKDWVQVAAGQYHSLALKADGSLFAWGSNQFGQLGNPTNSGTANPNPTPTRESMQRHLHPGGGGRLP